MSHPLTGKPKSRTHRDRIRASMLARYQRLREALGVQSIKDIYKANGHADAK